MHYRRYVFLPGYEGTQSIASKANRKEDEKIYHANKNDRSVTPYKEKGLSYYIISAEWVGVWRTWLTGDPKAPFPGKVTNKHIATKIMEYRMS